MKNILLILLLITLVNSCNMKNIWCKTEDGRYEIWGTTPYDMTERIEKEGCECLSESLLWNPKPKAFDPQQLQEIRQELPNWAMNNIPNFTTKDKQDLQRELTVMSDTDLLKKLKYRYSFFRYSRYQEIYVYTLKIKGKNAYCINYKEVYDHYENKEAYPPNDEFYEKLKKYYPIIENEGWARNEFGNSGVVYF